MGQFFVPAGKRIKSFTKDYPEFCKDMELNRWTERRVFCVLLGAANDLNEASHLGRRWLNKGTSCVKPESIADLR